MKTIYITLTADKGFTAEVDGKNIEYAFKENGYCLVDTERDSTPFEVTYPDEYEGYEAIVYLKNSHGGHTHVELGKIENGKVTHYLPQEMVCGGYTLVEYAASLNTELTKWKSIPVPVAQTGIDFLRATFPTRQEYVDILEAEKAREEAEAARRMAENVRESNEKQRIKNEEYRYLNELDRVKAEDTRQANEETRQANENERIEAEDRRAEFYEHYNEELERLDTAIETETKERTDADEKLGARVKAIEDDYLTSSDKEELTDDISDALDTATKYTDDKTKAVSDALTTYETATDARLDTLEESLTYKMKPADVDALFEEA